MKRSTMVLIAVLAACGPSRGGDDDGTGSGGVDASPGLPDAYTGDVGSISGTVWAPGNAPSMVPAGHAIPIFDAVVYLSLTPPPPIEQQAHCDQCVDPPGKAVFTDHLGNFSITNVVPNTYWVVIQKGQFRIEQQIVVGANTNIPLSEQQTTLPSLHDPANGRWVPRIAVATGSYDQIEDIIGKMGIGEVDANGAFVPASAAGSRVDIYSNGSFNMDAVAMDSLQNLFSMTTMRMMDYHIIFIPCSTQTFTGGSGLASAPPEVLEAVRAYVNAGGKLYVTDWSGEWEDNVFPEQIRFASDHDTPASAWNGTSWNTAQFGDADGSPSYESEHAYAVDDDLYAWLDPQQGPLVLGNFGGYGVGEYDAGNFVIEGNWDHIEELVDVTIGMDGEGFPIVDTPKAFIIGDEDGAPGTCAGGGAGCKTLTTTFEPTGCGRVLFSTYHTAENVHTGLVPQERVLLYLIMEIGVCKSGPIID